MDEVADAQAQSEEPTPIKHPFVTYTIARFSLLVAATGIFYLFGARGILLITLAFLASGLVSYILLDQSREQVGRRIAGYFSNMNKRIDESTRSEDEQIDLSDSAEPIVESAERAERARTESADVSTRDDADTK